jgi:hypothetical protein
MVINRVFLIFIFAALFLKQTECHGTTSPLRSKAPLSTTIKNKDPIKQNTSKRIYKGFTFGILSWQDSITLTDPAGTKYGIYANVLAPTLGFEWSMLSGKKQFLLQIQSFFGFADTGSQNRQLTYFQRGVPIYGAIASLEMLLHPSISRVAVGPAAFGFYRYGDWSVPSPDYTIQPSSLLSYGAKLEGRFYFSKWTISQSVGIIQGLNSAIWNFGGQFTW